MMQKAGDTELARIFMTRDHMSRNEAAAKVGEMRSLVWEGEDPEDLLWGGRVGTRLHHGSGLIAHSRMERVSFVGTCFICAYAQFQAMKRVPDW